jgi:hypothetical protein
VPVAVASRGDLERLLIALLQNEMPVPKPVRLLGIATWSPDLRVQYHQDFKKLAGLDF